MPSPLITSEDDSPHGFDADPTNPLTPQRDHVVRQGGRLRHRPQLAHRPGVRCVRAAGAGTARYRSRLPRRADRPLVGGTPPHKHVAPRSFGGDRCRLFPMDWQSLLGAGALGGSVASVLTYLGTVPFGPRKFRAWRLRRLSATMDALDPTRHAAQRAVLYSRQDRLADLVAAAYRVPTPWKRYVLAAGAFGFTVGNSYLLWRTWDPAIGLPTFIAASFITYALLLTYLWTVPYIRYVRRERNRFIEEGCPASFASTRTPDAIRDINDRRRQRRLLEDAARGRVEIGMSCASRRAAIARWLRRT